jgi:Xaa-Pro dipeptidase
MYDDPMATPEIANLYRDHLAVIRQQADRALARHGYDHLVIASGVEKYQFLDDRPYPFKPNPHFKHWVPLQRHPHCWISYTPGQRPVLVYHQPDDFWHLPPEAPEGFWAQHFDIRVIREPAEAARHLPTGRCAIIGEADAALPGFAPNDPRALVDHLHWHRAMKTPYELARMREASALAARAHLAARDGFVAGHSEHEIHRAYLEACGHTDLDLPYGNIVGLNEHAAVLHYQYQDRARPAAHRTLLIDAGAEVHGYAADITRTWTRAQGAFTDLVGAVDEAQLALCAMVRPGVDYRDIQRQTHLLLGGILRDAGLVRMDPEEQLATGVSATFFPHGVGHLLGLQVHDVGGFLASEDGGRVERPEGQPFLRLTRVLQPGMVVTIEPGLYFIPTLLGKLRARPEAAAVDWAAVEAMLPFGGIRIEDDVACTDGETCENLTRDAFAALGE